MLPFTSTFKHITASCVYSNYVLICFCAFITHIHVPFAATLRAVQYSTYECCSLRPVSVRVISCGFASGVGRAAIAVCRCHIRAVTVETTKRYIHWGSIRSVVNEWARGGGGGGWGGDSCIHNIAAVCYLIHTIVTSAI